MSNFPKTNRYLRERTLYPPWIASRPADDLRLVVVIPARDEPEIERTLASLARCTPPVGSAEVIVVFNESEIDVRALRARHEATISRLSEWAKTAPLKLHCLHPPPLPKKHAGVGLARKIGMDEAVRRLPDDGIILCFDADSLCEENYLSEVERAFSENPKAVAASIGFEHPLEGEKFTDDVYEAITEYELHLRYFVEAQRWAGLPYAIQTIGSSMAVRSHAYQSQNGMNRRKAGEDFYFLHKFTSLGPEAVIEINQTRVLPSPRVSDRVPFGTGKAVGELLKNRGQLSYAPETFQMLKSFVDDPTNEVLPPTLSDFLDAQSFTEKLDEIQGNTRDECSFRRRLFRWFDAFMVMKFAHFSRDNAHPNVPILDAAAWLAGKKFRSAREALLWYREEDLNR